MNTFRHRGAQIKKPRPTLSTDDFPQRGYASPMSAENQPPKRDDIHPSSMGKFIQTYSGFLSTFVIGVAGLVATSIWQYRQSQNTLRQAESEQKIAATKADNEWRIARAEILAKNLGVLSTQGANTVDQRFGVLLSLTRGAILDSELAVSYAVELGKDKASYMKDVLAATERKNYNQLGQAFVLTCLQRYGVRRDAVVCKDDKLVDRSDAIADLLHEELDALDASGDTKAMAQGPRSLLRNEREVQASVAKLAWLFEPYLQDLYEKKQWKEIAQFEASSAGAKLVAAIVLATARTGEMTGAGESADIEKFHAEHRKWLGDYLLGKSCDPECRGRLFDVMLSVYGESDGDYDEIMRRLLSLPRNESGPALGKLHTRLQWCQVDKDDLALFRDRVLVPNLAAMLARPMSGATSDAAAAAATAAAIDELIAFVAMTPDPTEGPSRAAWNALMAAMQKTPEHRDRAFGKQRMKVKRERADPPPMVKKYSFCGLAESADATENE
jgi:hypothetical protein